MHKKWARRARCLRPVPRLALQRPGHSISRLPARHESVEVWWALVDCEKFKAKPDGIWRHQRCNEIFPLLVALPAAPGHAVETTGRLFIRRTDGVSGRIPAS